MAAIALPAFVIGWVAAKHRNETDPVGLKVAAIQMACPRWLDVSVSVDKRRECLHDLETFVHNRQQSHLYIGPENKLSASAPQP